MIKYTEVMVRYGELSTKGKNRKDFIGRLAGNVTKVLNDFPEIEIHPRHDRMHIVLNGAPFEESLNMILTNLILWLVTICLIILTT